MPAPTSGAGGKFTVARITVALGDLVPLIDEWAARKGTQRPDAVRRLLAIALGVDPPPTRRNRPAPPRNELAAAYAESGLRGVGKRYGAASTNTASPTAPQADRGRRRSRPSTCPGFENFSPQGGRTKRSRGSTGATRRRCPSHSDARGSDPPEATVPKPTSTSGADALRAAAADLDLIAQAHAAALAADEHLGAA